MSPCLQLFVLTCSSFTGNNQLIDLLTPPRALVSFHKEKKEKPNASLQNT